MMRPTSRGIGVAASSLLTGVMAWLLGLTELAALSAGGLTMVAAAAVLVLVQGSDIVLDRTVRPPRVHVGGRCEVDLVAHNRSRRRSGVISVHDRVGDSGASVLAFAPIAPDERSGATFSMPTRRRGIHHLGPIRISLADPFGLVRRTWDAGQRCAVVVLPTFWHLDRAAAIAGDEMDLGGHSVAAESSSDADFANLREWVPGDDVRRIHWRSTARRGVPVVRQFDLPWQRRTTVLVDLNIRSTTHAGPAAFERAVSAAASVVMLAARGDEMVRLVQSDGRDSGYVSAAEHSDQLMDQLAVVVADRTTFDDRSADLVLLKSMKALDGTDAARLVVCSAVDKGHLERLAAPALARSAAAGREDRVHILIATAEDPSATRETAVDRHHGLVAIALGEDSSLESAWAHAAESHTTTVRP